MQKFEKVPESKVVFDAEVAAGVRSQVPGSEFPLAQCLAGERWDVGTWRTVWKPVLPISQDKPDRTTKTGMKTYTLAQTL